MQSVRIGTRTSLLRVRGNPLHGRDASRSLSAELYGEIQDSDDKRVGYESEHSRSRMRRDLASFHGTWRPRAMVTSSPPVHPRAFNALGYFRTSVCL